MEDLFGNTEEKPLPPELVPLAERIRTKTLSGVVGQEHLTAKGKVLEVMIRSGRAFSAILWGPPGSGKTTLAKIIAAETGSLFRQISAVSSGVKDLREIIAKAASGAAKGKGTVLFIDEIHRFNKGQQDALLDPVEKGVVRLIGATTENPSFEVNPALLSRCRVLKLELLNEAAMENILDRALFEDPAMAGVVLEQDARKVLVESGGGDARKMLNTLELAAELTAAPVGGGSVLIGKDELIKALSDNRKKYDKSGEYHYDIISAFIKSLRGSDPDAALYWLARMLDAGEKPEFIARRMIIFASEDVGNASPNALILAQACFDAVHTIGMPEGRIILAQAATYLASQPKSNASYMGISAALEAVEKEGESAEVPLHLRNSPTKLLKELGYGKEYKYPHDFDGHFVEEDYLPQFLQGRQFYIPTEEGLEKQIKERLASKWKGKKKY